MPMARRSTPVMGVHAAAPRVTPQAVVMLVGYVGLPLLTALVLFDVFIWAVVKLIWGGCYGLWCWF